MRRRGSLARRLALLISTGFAAVWLLAVLATALVLRSEQEEMLNLELRETARVLLPVLSRDYLNGIETLDTFPYPAPDDDEALVWLLVDRSGEIVARSLASDAIDVPEGPVEEGYVVTATHVFFTTPATAEGLALRFGDPRIERFEAYRDSFLAFLVPMLAILPLGYLLVGWIARAALRPLAGLRDEIEARDHGRLDPIDTKGQPGELQAITATLNGFMVRLAGSLEGERAFATNAAHELRTPVAIALAQVQRLKAEVTGDMAGRVERVEEALKRMGRLVTRLLQLARTDAGIGLVESATDVRQLLYLVLEEVRRDPVREARLSVSMPHRPVSALMDPDAFAIIAGNLIDNAFQHAAAGSIVEVSLSSDGIMHVRNGGRVIDSGMLAELTRRFRTNNNGNGFGLGLHISDAIARQAGGRLTLRSPARGRETGFEAEFRLPMDNRAVSEP